MAPNRSAQRVFAAPTEVAERSACRGHPVLGHEPEFYGFFSVIGPFLFAVGAVRVYSGSDFDASLERPLKLAFREILALSRACIGGEPECHECARFNHHPD